jgi:hypothetical protein
MLRSRRIGLMLHGYVSFRAVAQTLNRSYHPVLDILNHHLRLFRFGRTIRTKLHRNSRLTPEHA